MKSQGNKYIKLYLSGTNPKQIAALRNWDIARLESVRDFLRHWTRDADLYCDAVKRVIIMEYKQYQEWRKSQI